MAFDPESNKVPTSIGRIEIVVTDNETGTDELTYHVQVKDAAGDVFSNKRGNLVPHLSAAQISGLQALAADVRVKAQVLIP